MPRLLNPQHEAFCHAYVRGPHAFSLIDAYEAAGYARDRANAWRLAQRADVVARIAALREGEEAAERAAMRAACAEHAVSRARMVGELAAIAFANPLDYLSVDKNGALQVDGERLAQAKGGAFRDLSLDCTTTADGEQKVKLRVRLNDKHKALAGLERLMALAQEPPAKRSPAEGIPFEQLKDQLIAMLRDLAEQGEDVLAFATRAVAAAGGATPVLEHEDESEVHDGDAVAPIASQRYAGESAPAAEGADPTGHGEEPPDRRVVSFGRHDETIPDDAAPSSLGSQSPATTSAALTGNTVQDRVAAPWAPDHDEERAMRGPHLPHHGAPYLATVLSMPE